MPAARTAPDGEKRASTVVTHHSSRAQHEARWNRRLQELREFKDEHGHLVVPLTPEHRPLHNWVYQQRRMHREGKLVDTRIAPLDAIGFEWKPTRGRKTGQGVGETRSRVFQDQWSAMLEPAALVPRRERPLQGSQSRAPEVTRLGSRAAAQAQAGGAHGDAR